MNSSLINNKATSLQSNIKPAIAQLDQRDSLQGKLRKLVAETLLIASPSPSIEPNSPSLRCLVILSVIIVNRPFT